MLNFGAVELLLEPDPERRRQLAQHFAPPARPSLNTASTRILGRTMRDAARNKEWWKGAVRLPKILVLTQPQNRVVVLAVPTLNTIAPSRVTLSLQ